MHPYRTYTIFFALGMLALGVGLFAVFLAEGGAVRFVMLFASLLSVALATFLGYLLLREKRNQR